MAAPVLDRRFVLPLLACAGLVPANLPAQTAAPAEPAPAATIPLSVASIFTDHAVLQRGEQTLLWGRTAPGETVSVEFAGQVREARADQAGHWRLALEGLEASAEGRPLTVHDSDESLTLEDVVVGEVWLFSGQSNMEWDFTMGSLAAEDLAAFRESAPNPQLRIAHVQRATVWPPAERLVLHGGGWRLSDPAQVADVSVMGWFIGRELQQRLGVPVGVVCSAWGGTSIERWLPRDPALPAQAETGDLWAGMIHPLEPLSLAGVVWYQGESNRAAGFGYAEPLGQLIAGWRTRFTQPELPFYLCQIAPFQYPDLPDKTTGAEVWRAQQAVAEANEAVTVVASQDLGELQNIHPGRKQILAKRVAATILAQEYRVEGVQTGIGPRFRSAELVDQGRGGILLSFDTHGPLRLPEGKELGLFQVGTGGALVLGVAEIVGENQVRVRITPELPAVQERFDPADWSVRYAWGIDRESFLTDDTGAPLMSFRTDAEPWAVRPE